MNSINWQKLDMLYCALDDIPYEARARRAVIIQLAYEVRKAEQEGRHDLPAMAEVEKAADLRIQFAIWGRGRGRKR